MFKPKELGLIVIMIIILGFSITIYNLLLGSADILKIFSINVLLIGLVVFVNLIAKKITAFYYEIDIKPRVWSFQRFWFKEHYHFKKPIPLGFIFPLIISFASYGWFYWLAVFQFDEKPLPARRAKRHGYYSFSELTEWDIGLIAAIGVIANLVFALFAYFIDLPYFIEFAKLSFFYAVYSLIPFGKLDGTKIFFGSYILWISLVIVCLAMFGIGLLAGL